MNDWTTPFTPEEHEFGHQLCLANQFDPIGETYHGKQPVPAWMTWAGMSDEQKSAWYYRARFLMERGYGKRRA